MQRTTKQWLMVLAIISIAFAYFMFFSKPEDVKETQTDTLISNTNNKQTALSESKKETESVSLFQLKEQCDNNKLKIIKKFAHPKWLTFRKNIYAQGIRYPVLQLALKNANAIVLHPSLHQKPKQKHKAKPSKFLNELSQETQMKLFGALLSEGVIGISERVDKGEFPSEVLSESPTTLYRIIIGLSSDAKINHSLPNEEELSLLISYGLEISVEDYNEATKINAPTDYLNLLTIYGPAPESLNFQYEKIPVDIAAEKSNLMLLEFWLATGFTSNNKLQGGDYSDTLLLSSSTAKQFNQAWEFLNLHNKTPTDPNTAKILLKSKKFLIEENIRKELTHLASKKSSGNKLNDADYSIYQTAFSDIVAINQLILESYPNYKKCHNNTNNESKTNYNSQQWVWSQLKKGKSVENILKTLAQKSPSLVDTFRRNLNQGLYEPVLKPNPEQEFKLLIDEETQQFIGLILLKDWESINTILNSNLLSDQVLMSTLSSNSGLKIPSEMIDAIVQKIETIPLGGYNSAAKSLSLEKFEKMELDTEALNKLDESGKNLFFYATKNNNIELMNWLLEKNVEMDPDKYGSDPLDAALRWNTHPETLQTLCNLDFPIKNKHKKRFLDIQKEDPDEAIEILERCPGFAE